MFIVSVTYSDGVVKWYTMPKDLWRDIVRKALETDENVTHYDVYNS